MTLILQYVQVKYKSDSLASTYKLIDTRHTSDIRHQTVADHKNVTCMLLLLLLLLLLLWLENEKRGHIYTSCFIDEGGSLPA